MSGLFQRALVSGINQRLIQHGHTSYMSKEAAALASDTVANYVFGPGEIYADGEGVPAEKVAAAVDGLLKVSSELKSQYGNHEDANLKLAASTNIGDIGAYEVHRLMVKQAAEAEGMETPAAAVADTGSTLMGGDKGNDEAQSPHAEAQMDTAQRPQGTYNVETGQQADAGRGPIGEEAPVDQPPPNSPVGDNSVTAASKMGSLQTLIQKLAMGSNFEGNDKGNKPEQAASVTGEAAMERKARPEGYAHVGVGNVNQPVAPAAVIGQETPHPEAPANSPAGTNSVIKMSHDEMFQHMFAKVAESTVAYMPQNLSDEQKVAAVRHMIGMSGAERGTYLGQLHKLAEEGEIPPQFLENVKEKEDDGEKKEEKKCDEDEKEDKEEEKKDEEKEASTNILLNRVRAIAAAAK